MQVSSGGCEFQVDVGLSSDLKVSSEGEEDMAPGGCLSFVLRGE